MRTLHKAGGERHDPGINVSQIYRWDEYAIRHPVIEPNGDIIFGDFHTPLVSLDACSKTKWVAYGAYHHAIERDADGHYWTSYAKMPLDNPHAELGFNEDTIVRFTRDGEILFEKSLTAMLLENDLGYMVYPWMPYNYDPYHLNDVQPALSDGPFWKKGDVFLSLRNQSTIILYRPSTNEVLWHKRGPWAAQHDVDIISDHEISIFNNNAGGGKTLQPVDHERGFFVAGTNDTQVYDFETDAVTSPYLTGYQALDIRTPIQGLNEILSNGDLWVEETVYGRLLVMDKDGEPKWSYVNRAKDGDVYIINWSRYIEGEEARILRERIAQGFECN